MEARTAINAFAALGQPTRLAVVRLLVTAGPEGLPAGEIGKSLDVPHNTMSSHLQSLERAGLIQSERQGRIIRYSADFQGIAALITYLMTDCCRGHEAICSPVFEAFAHHHHQGSPDETPACQPRC